jgi:hypothetical protein
MHPQLLAELAQQRQADTLRRYARGERPARRHALTSVAAGIARRARRETGWLLVDAGLRLAVGDEKPANAQ